MIVGGRGRGEGGEEEVRGERKGGGGRGRGDEGEEEVRGERKG